MVVLKRVNEMSAASDSVQLVRTFKRNHEEFYKKYKDSTPPISPRVSELLIEDILEDVQSGKFPDYKDIQKEIISKMYPQLKKSDQNRLRDIIQNLSLGVSSNLKREDPSPARNITTWMGVPFKEGSKVEIYVNGRKIRTHENVKDYKKELDSFLKSVVNTSDVRAYRASVSWGLDVELKMFSVKKEYRYNVENNDYPMWTAPKISGTFSILDSDGREVLRVQIVVCVTRTRKYRDTDGSWLTCWTAESNSKENDELFEYVNRQLKSLGSPYRVLKNQ